MSKNYNKEETIKRHREMWNWIADQVDSGAIDPQKLGNSVVGELKLETIKALAIHAVHPEDDCNLFNNNYLCDYANRLVTRDYANRGSTVCYDWSWDRCEFCPLGREDASGPGNCLDGIYGELIGVCDEDGDMMEFVGWARDVADLPEKEEV